MTACASTASTATLLKKKQHANILAADANRILFLACIGDRLLLTIATCNGDIILISNTERSWQHWSGFADNGAACRTHQRPSYTGVPQLSLPAQKTGCLYQSLLGNNMVSKVLGIISSHGSMLRSIYTQVAGVLFASGLAFMLEDCRQNRP